MVIGHFELNQVHKSEDERSRNALSAVMSSIELSRLSELLAYLKAGDLRILRAEFKSDDERSRNVFEAIISSIEFS